MGDTDYSEIFTPSQTAGARKPRSEAATMFYRVCKDIFHGYDLPEDVPSRFEVIYNASELLTSISRLSQLHEDSASPLVRVQTAGTSTLDLFIELFHLLYAPYRVVLSRSQDLRFAKACYSLASHTIFALLDMSLNVRQFQFQVTPDIAEEIAVHILFLMWCLDLGIKDPISEAINDDPVRISETRRYLTCLFQVWVRWTSAENHERPTNSHQELLDEIIQLKSGNGPTRVRKKEIDITESNPRFGPSDDIRYHGSIQASKSMAAQMLYSLLDYVVPPAIRKFSEPSSLHFGSLSSSIIHVMHIRNGLCQREILSDIYRQAFGDQLTHFVLAGCCVRDSLPTLYTGDDLIPIWWFPIFSALARGSVDG
ncbi:hypothetical protein LTR84_007429 [Exophiala bonariae]|uniref:Transcription factor domain-containing protein n=1 Tax=Exophiala bonariae TaxID=1690606 RepID=A0AAV9MY78_9EURO|nr:hypothetical protein LTR84_007429 [Exophiala bonariae]